MGTNTNTHRQTTPTRGRIIVADGIYSVGDKKEYSFIEMTRNAINIPYTVSYIYIYIICSVYRPATFISTVLCTLTNHNSHHLPLSSFFSSKSLSNDCWLEASHPSLSSSVHLPCFSSSTNQNLMKDKSQ